MIFRKIFFAFALFFVLSTAVFADGVGLIDAAKNAGIEIECPDGVANCSAETEYETADAQNFVLRLVGGLLNFVAVVAVVMLVIAAIRLVTALGNQENLQAAKKQLIWTFAGLAIIILALLIVRNITEKIYKVAEIETECLTLVADGLLGSNTYKAIHEETPNLAGSFIEDEKGDCRNVLELETVLDMPLRESKDTECLPVLDFQEAYNEQTCDKKTGEREDI